MDKLRTRPYTHPGIMLKIACIDGLDITLAEIAQRLHIGRARLSRILRGKTGISADLAIKLEMAGLGNAQTWHNAQKAYEIWQAKQRPQPGIVPILAPEKTFLT